jgi:hypothetical protein
MLKIYSLVTGEVLGFAKDESIARDMARTNGWRTWYVEDDRVPAPAAGEAQASDRRIDVPGVQRKEG